MILILLSLLILSNSLPLPSPSSILSSMSIATSFFQKNHYIPLGDCGWQISTYFAGSMAYYNISNDKSLIEDANKWAEDALYICWIGPYALNPNNYACGMTYATLFDISPDYKKLALQSTLNNALKESKLYSWWWVDTFFMALGTWYHYGKILNNTIYWDFAYSQYKSTAYGGPNGSVTQPGLWDSNLGLFYRDYSYINKTTPNGKPIIWSRGNGWAVSAFVKSLKTLPSDHPYAIEYKKKLVSMANSLKQYQGNDGFWRSSLLDYSEFSNPETTGTSSFVYGIAYGINNI